MTILPHLTAVFEQKSKEQSLALVICDLMADEMWLRVTPYVRDLTVTRMLAGWAMY